MNLFSLVGDPVRDACIPNPCFQSATCQTGSGGEARCPACPRGYRGDGSTCIKTVTCSDTPCYTGK